MASRLELQSMLEGLLGSRNVYFQPPESIKMKYPAVVYALERIDTTKADNSSYLKNKAYQLNYITTNPDDTMVDTILELPSCAYVQTYKSENLYHHVFRLYF